MPAIPEQPRPQRKGAAGAPTVAVIGGGIAGLTAAYRLGESHRVTLYERHPSPGLAFHGATGGGPQRVDVPLRVMTEGHYRNLLALYDELGVATESIPHSCSYSALSADGQLGATFLRYGPSRAGVPNGSAALSDRGQRVLLDLHKFVGQALRDLESGAARGLSLRRYLDGCGVGAGLAHDFILPSFAGICTCSLQTAENFPADIALQLVLSGMHDVKLRRVKGGASEAADQFVARLQDFQGGVPIRRVEQQGEQVRVTTADGASASYDRVVVATPANRVDGLVELTERERGLLGRVAYETARVVVHRDPSLVPAREQRGAFNFLVGTPQQPLTATIWVQAIQPDMDGDLLQTVNPAIEPEPATVLTDIRLERAMVSADNAGLGEEVAALNEDRRRRIHFCGAYGARGVPLLESGVVSAQTVARAIAGGDDAPRMAVA